MIVLAVVLLIYMVPTLTETFEGLGAELPLSTRVIIFLSDFLIAHTLLVIFLLVVLVSGSIASFKSATGKRILDSVFIRVPLIGTMIREFQSARTARTLSSLLSSGVEIVSALSVTEDVLQNHLYKET